MVTAQTADRILDETANDIWWMGIVQGILAIFFGITAIFWPDLTLVTLVYLFSAFILAIGIFEIIQGLVNIRQRGTWWITLLIGLIGLGAGIYLVRHPDVSFETFILVVGLGLIARGLLDIVRVFIDREATVLAPRILLAFIGAAAVVAGIVILLQPVAGGIAFVWILGLYAIIYGALSMAISFYLRSAFLVALVAVSPDQPAVNASTRTPSGRSSSVASRRRK